MNAWQPPASYPCGNLSDTSSRILIRPQGSSNVARMHKRYALLKQTQNDVEDDVGGHYRTTSRTQDDVEDDSSTMTTETQDKS